MRCVKSSLDTLGYDDVDLKTDNSMSIIEMAENDKAVRSLLVTRLRIGSLYQHEDPGAVERMQQCIQEQVRAMQLDFQAWAQIRLAIGAVPFRGWSALGLERDVRLTTERYTSDSVRENLREDFGRGDHEVRRSGAPARVGDKGWYNALS